jgi:uncharacterized protein (TIGR02145 family)
MKLTKLLILLLLLSLKGFSQQAVLTSSGEKVILNFLSSLGGTITGTLGITGNTTISGTTTLTGINNTGTITNTGALINTGNLTVNGNGTITGTLTTGAVTYPNSLGTDGQTLTVSGTALTWKTSTAAVAAVFLPTIVIGTQQWMKENLDVLTYRNGDVITQITNTTDWGNATTGAWCYYNNDPDNGAIYGKLYNWYAVNDSRGLAPQGWHIPTDAEWTTLGTLLGGDAAAGGKMKTTGITRWTSPNTSATNESGFSGLPGGVRGYLGTFVSVGTDGYWWSATEYNSSFAWYRDLDYYDGYLDRSTSNKRGGLSVRCLRD